MDESLGTLSFKFKAEKDAFRADLMDMDRTVAEYRRKWEAAIRIPAGAGSGVGAGSVAGPHITGTSNGDVTWKLQNAVAQTQSRAEGNAYRMAMGMVGGGGYSTAGGGRTGGIDPDMLREARAAKREADRDARVQRVRTAQDLQNKIDAADMESKKYGDGFNQLEKMKGGGGTPASQSGSMNVIRRMIRSSVAVAIVESVAGELNNAENYKKAMRLAGNDSGEQAQAVLGNAKGAFGAVPLVGGLAYSLANGIIGAVGGPSAQSIETSLALTEKQNQLQDASTQIRLGAISQRYGSQAMLAGNTFRGREIQSKEAKIGRDADLRGLQSQLESAAGMEGTKTQSLPLWVYLSQAATPYTVPFLSKADAMYTDRFVNPGIEARNREKRVGINATLSVKNAANRASTDAEARERGFEAAYTIDQQGAQITQGDYNAQYRYTGGMAARTALGYRARAADAQRRGMNGDDRQILLNEGTIAIQGLQQAQRDNYDSYRYGSGRSYDPFVESTLGFTDRNPETMTDANDSLETSIKDLTQVMRKIAERGGNE